MSRQPAHIENPEQSREAIWTAIRRYWGDGGEFAAADVRGALKGVTPKARLRTYLHALAAGGYLARSIVQGRTSRYQLIRDTGVEPPRVRRDGTQVTQGQGRAALWQVLRVLRGPLSAIEAAANASSPEHPVALGEAVHYLNWLTRAGYCRRDGCRYLLVNNTGPKAPQIQRVRQVWDPNTKCVVWPEGGAL